MQNRIKANKKTFLSLVIAAASTLALTGCNTMHGGSNTATSSDNNHVSVNGVDWVKHAATTYQAPRADQIPSNMAHVVFVRPATNLADQSSANVSLDNRYLVSLQGGNYTQTDICAGPALLSVVPTGVKINDLQANGKSYNLVPQQTYYFAVDVDRTSGQPSLTPLDSNTALDMLKDKAYQTHQVTRIVNTCAPVVMQQPAIIAPAVVAPAAKAIQLAVKFDTAKSIVKDQYKKEIADVAAYLTQYPTLTAVVEGHTDNVGKPEANQRLSQSRAEAVKQQLINDGVSADRLQAIGYGETRPMADNNSVVGRAENRRVVVQTH